MIWMYYIISIFLLDFYGTQYGCLDNISLYYNQWEKVTIFTHKKQQENINNIEENNY